MMWGSFLLLLSLPLVNGYAGIGAACQEFLTTNGGDATQFVCAYHEFYGPSIAVIEDEVFYVGDFIDIYNIAELGDDMNPEQVESMDPSSLNISGYIIQVTRFTEVEGCQVSMGGTNCTGCEVCTTVDGSPEISVDCSAVQGGRSVQCEPVGKVFYPLEGFSRAASPTSAPVGNPGGGESGCLVRGSQCTTSLQCCSGRCMMNECRTSSINGRFQRSSLRETGRGGAAGAAIDVAQGKINVPEN